VYTIESSKIMASMLFFFSFAVFLFTNQLSFVSPGRIENYDSHTRSKGSCNVNVLKMGNAVAIPT
jgi:hypothetical protein